MTQQEYEQKEQKKLECYRELKKQDSSGLLSIATFEFIFDRAYSLGKHSQKIFDNALGKQTETITQEEIEKMAEEYVLTRQQARHNAKKEEDATMCDFDKTMKAWDAYDMEQSFEAGANLFLGKQEKDADTVIQGWVFVDETTFDRHLCVRKVTQGDYEAVWDSGHPEFCLGEELFPDMVPNKLPEPVEIIIKRKKK